MTNSAGSQRQCQTQLSGPRLSSQICPARLLDRRHGPELPLVCYCELGLLHGILLVSQTCPMVISPSVSSSLDAAVHFSACTALSELIVSNHFHARSLFCVFPPRCSDALAIHLLEFCRRLWHRPLSSDSDTGFAAVRHAAVPSAFAFRAALDRAGLQFRSRVCFVSNSHPDISKRRRCSFTEVCKLLAYTLAGTHTMCALLLVMITTQGCVVISKHLLSSRRTASCASRSTKASISSLQSTLAAGPEPAAAIASSCCCCRFLRSASVTRRNLCVLMALRRHGSSRLSGARSHGRISRVLCPGQGRCHGRGQGHWRMSGSGSQCSRRAGAQGLGRPSTSLNSCHRLIFQEATRVQTEMHA